MKLLNPLIATVAICATPAISNAQGRGEQVAKTFEKQIVKNLKAGYLLYLPKDYEKQESWPLLLFLHGAGERGDDLELVKVHGPPKLIAQGKIPAGVSACAYIRGSSRATSRTSRAERRAMPSP